MGFKTKHLGMSVIEERFVGNIPFDQGVCADIEDTQAFTRSQIRDERVHATNIGRFHGIVRFLSREQGDPFRL